MAAYHATFDYLILIISNDNNNNAANNSNIVFHTSHSKMGAQKPLSITHHHISY